MTLFTFLQFDMGHSQHLTASTISLVLANQVEEILNGRDDQYRGKRKESSHPVTGAAYWRSLQSTTSDGREKKAGSTKKVQDVTENLLEVPQMIQNKRLLEYDEKDKQPDKRPKTFEQVNVENNEDRLDEHHKINEIKKESVEIGMCKCDEALKARAIKDFLENSKELDSKFIVKRIKEILDPYTLDFIQEDDTEIKTELVSVRTDQ